MVNSAKKIGTAVGGTDVLGLASDVKELLTNVG